jgi:alpha-1,2-mannosyltransferase
MIARGGIAERVPPALGIPALGVMVRRWPVPGVIGICAFCALVLRAWLLSRPGHLLGVTEADDGVMFGTALRLVNGVLPYRDFSDVQPPGSFLLLVPAAMVAKVTGSAWGLAIARMFTVAADTACVVLIGLLVRRRGMATVVMACGIYAVYPDALDASHTFLLEPWLNLFCLLGAVAVFDGDEFTVRRRRLALGGAAFGFAAAIKLWAFAPLVILAVLLLCGSRRRRTIPLAAGAVAGFGIPSLPFWLLAPGAFVSGVFTGQYVRSGAGQHALSVPRLADLIGGWAAGSLPDQLTVLVVVALVVFVAVGYVVQRPRALDCYAVICCVVVFVMVLLPRLYYSHYGSFLGPFLALTVALPAGHLASRLGSRLTLCLSAVAVVLLAVVGVRSVQVLTPVPKGPSVAVGQRLIPAGACVLTDVPSYLVAADRFATKAGCPDLVDPQGTLIAMTNGAEMNAPRAVRARVAAVWLAGFEQAEYVWLFSGDATRVPWTPALHAYLLTHFRLIAFGNAYGASRDVPPSGLYVRR